MMFNIEYVYRKVKGIYRNKKPIEDDVFENVYRLKITNNDDIRDTEIILELGDTELDTLNDLIKNRHPWE